MSNYPNPNFYGGGLLVGLGLVILAAVIYAIRVVVAFLG